MTAERIRFTISVEPEVHAAFVEMAEASGQSLSRVVGEWLRDTSESARFVSSKMRELRLAPAQALLELAVVQDRAAQATRDLAGKVQRTGVRGVGGAAQRADRPATRVEPPCSPTGVNTPRKGRSRP